MDVPFTWKLGIDNVSKVTNLPFGAVADMVNTDIDRAGTLDRRGGAGFVSGRDAHSLWTSDVRDESFAIVDGVLCKINMPWFATPLYTVTQDVPFYYTDLNDDVIASSNYDIVVIASDLTVRRMGLETPGLNATGDAVGGLNAGRHGVAVSFLRGNEEGPLSRIAFADVPQGGGLMLHIQPASESLPTGVRVYRTQANGDVLMRTVDLIMPVTTYLLGVTPVGRQTKTWALERMLPGEHVCYWKGLLWVVRGQFAWHSEPMRYGAYSRRFNYVPMQNPIRMFVPVEGGIFVGTREGVYFLSGKGPREFEVQKRGGVAPWKGTGRLIPVSLLGDEGETGEYAAIWMSDYGFVVGRKDGSIHEPQRKRINVVGTAGASVVADRRIVVTAI